MSTSETDEFAVCDCPCGGGKVIMSVTTQDNPWSTADISYELRCNPCTLEWQISGRALVSRRGEAAARVARDKWMGATEDLNALVDPLVDQYFEEFDARSGAAEFREMERLGITNRSLADVRSSRRDGDAVSERCAPLKNKQWVQGLVDAAGLGQQYAVLLGHQKAAEEAGRAAGRNVQRIPIPRI